MHSKRRIKRDKKNCVQPEAYGRTVKVRWGYLILLGILFSLEVAAFSANAQELQPERMQAIKKADNQASVNWKLVSQEINEKTNMCMMEIRQMIPCQTGYCRKSVMEAGDMS